MRFGLPPQKVYNEAYKEIRNKVVIDGHLNAALNAVMASNEPDAIFSILGELVGQTIEIAQAKNVAIHQKWFVRSTITRLDGSHKASALLVKIISPHPMDAKAWLIEYEDGNQFYMMEDALLFKLED